MMLVLGGCFSLTATATPPTYQVKRIPFAAGYQYPLVGGFQGTITNDGTIYTHQSLIGKTPYKPFKYGKDLVPQMMTTPTTNTQWSVTGFSRSGKNFIWHPSAGRPPSGASSNYLSVDGKVIIPPMPKFQNYTIDRVKFTQINDDGIAVGVAELNYQGIVRWGVKYDTRTGEYTLGRNDPGYVDEVYWSINNAGQILSGANGWIFDFNHLNLHGPDGSIEEVTFVKPSQFLLTDQGNVMLQPYTYGGTRLSPAIWTNGTSRMLKVDPKFATFDALFNASSDNGIVVGEFDAGANDCFVGVGDTLYTLSDYILRTGEMTNFKITNALSVNRSGQILCVGNTSSTDGGYYLLQPVPEPSTWLALGTGIALVARRQRRL